MHKKKRERKKKKKKSIINWRFEKLVMTSLQINTIRYKELAITTSNHEAIVEN